jgi:hypothetical protein
MVLMPSFLQIGLQERIVVACWYVARATENSRGWGRSYKHLFTVNSSSDIQSYEVRCYGGNQHFQWWRLLVGHSSSGLCDYIAMTAIDKKFQSSSIGRWSTEQCFTEPRATLLPPLPERGTTGDVTGNGQCHSHWGPLDVDR